MNRRKQSFMSFLLPILLIILVFSYIGDIFNTSNNIGIGELVKNISSNKVKKITTKGSKVEGVLKDNSTFVSELPAEFQNNFYDNYLKKSVDAGQIEYQGLPVDGPNIFIQILPTLILLGGLSVLWYIFMARGANGSSQAMKFGKSRAKMNLEKNNNITFADVAGLREEKEEMEELVDFLKNPKKYVEQGARIPKGVLLVGQPGTGKTYISKAVAGEAKVPFYSISGSDFVEMFVGVGASRVRDMFAEAKKNAPCIIFIDEIDAVGRKRGSGLGGGHDEREQTLNQLLVEMDGFEKNEGIIMIAATNRPDILDPALLRPGRFDRTIHIGMPDVKERYEILQVHTRNKKLSESINLENVAKSTAGFSPAELENLTNEAALLAARNNQEFITPDLMDEAAIRIMAGPEKKSKVVIERERKLTAYHEAGHAVTAQFLKDLDPVHMITIVPRGQAGGFTAYLPDEDKTFRTKGEMKNRIVALLGGRAAEEIVLDDISTGASNDIERATHIARAMIKIYGMSDILGPVQYDDASGNVFLGGNNYSKGDHYSEKTAIEIDKEVTDIIKSAYVKAKEIIVEHRDLLEELAQELLKKETIRKDEYIEIVKKYDINFKEEEVSFTQNDEK
ncbi:ATP-dependent zinc metalloprotease FtsH [Helcococcus ovis]|uniref:ATP-dependent zinc metalloprotease FtsH n=1 Tax=Helcococcus ovis TaxID=72026 RepID=UPI001070429B|nr:ATP-dependent zinc metalloprotease FtsH [Helcococcus ovis]TFF66921.1 ATP-dependent zinc metalloprotease FtsH [Helcococcus ovis]WNZ01835.1 ATP-dependent zinc metalloprotease FtsH [Helcococcus ovis]